MFEIVVDSAANIPAELVKKNNIRVISFVNSLPDSKMVCYEPDLTMEEEREKGKAFYESMRQGMDVKTSLISTGDFEDFFKAILAEGKDILYISLSKNISGNFNSARLAAEELMDSGEYTGRIRMVDALNASLGQGILAIYANEMREQGMDFDAVADKIETYPQKMNGVFTVGDLKYISRTGRITGVTAMIGNILSIKPILRGDKDGYIVQFEKYRGRKKALNALIDLLCNNIENPEEQIIGIAHADAYEESLYVMEEIQKRVKVREFINTSYDFCTGVHVGPDTVALFFMAKDRELAN